MKQVAVFSATYPKGLEAVLKNYMKQSTLLRLNEKEESLIAVKEYCVYCKNVMKGDVLVKLLSKVVFTQCIIFCDTQHLCERVLEYLMKNRINVTMITGNLPQKERFEVMDKLKKRQIKVLISTDLVRVYSTVTYISNIFINHVIFRPPEVSTLQLLILLSMQLPLLTLTLTFIVLAVPDVLERTAPPFIFFTTLMKSANSLPSQNRKP